MNRTPKRSVVIADIKTAERYESENMRITRWLSLWDSFSEVALRVCIEQNTFTKPKPGLFSLSKGNAIRIMILSRPFIKQPFS